MAWELKTFELHDVDTYSWVDQWGDLSVTYAQGRGEARDESGVLVSALETLGNDEVELRDGQVKIFGRLLLPAPLSDGIGYWDLRPM